MQPSKRTLLDQVSKDNWICASSSTDDELLLTLPMEPGFIAPNPRVDALRGSVALQRGPLVYCFESHDQPEGVDLLDAQVVTTEPPAAERAGLLGGVVTLQVTGRMVAKTWGEALYRPLAEVAEADARPVRLVAVLYYAWGNRGMQSMRVWVPATDALAGR